jgi:hypothetical protein
MPYYSEADIVIELRFMRERPLDAKILSQALDTLEVALYASDRRDIERITLELDLPTLAKDASLERLREHRNRRLLLTEARTGSLILEGVVAGVALFVLKNTLGEAFKDGFRETDSFNRIKDFFRREIDNKALFIAEHIRRAFASRRGSVTVQALPPGSDQPNRIVVELTPGRLLHGSQEVRSLGEELDRGAS